MVKISIFLHQCGKFREKINHWVKKRKEINKNRFVAIMYFCSKERKKYARTNLKMIQSRKIIN